MRTILDALDEVNRDLKSSYPECLQINRERLTTITELLAIGHQVTEEIKPLLHQYEMNDENF